MPCPRAGATVHGVRQTIATARELLGRWHQPWRIDRHRKLGVRVRVLWLCNGTDFVLQGTLAAAQESSVALFDNLNQETAKLCPLLFRYRLAFANLNFPGNFLW